MAYLADSATGGRCPTYGFPRRAQPRQRSGRVSAEVAMGKLYATEAAQRIIDRAVRIFGGLGVTRGSCVENSIAR